MGTAHFIARRIFSGKDRQDRLSRPIVSIAIVGIILGMAVMIITVAVTKGFQREIQEKIIGIGGHIQITSIRMTDPKETPRTPIDRSFYPALDTVAGVAHIQIHATKPGIVETADDIQGVIVKGVGADHDWSYVQAHLISGEVLEPSSTDRKNDVLVSRYLSDRLRIGTGDAITIYLIKGREEARPRKFTVKGVYETGLEQVDHQLVFVDIGHLQRFSQWGVQAEILVSDTVRNGMVEVKGLAFGGDKVYDHEWLDADLYGPGPHMVPLPLEGPRTLTLVVHDADNTIPDTAWVALRGAYTHRSRATSDAASGGFDSVLVDRGGGGGSYDKYVGGFEVSLTDFGRLDELDDLIYEDHLDPDLKTSTVRSRFPEIFAWLELLDTNVVVIIVLMVLVAVINMISALLIIILERTRMIGVLKALGASNGLVQGIFILDGAYILGIGIFLGDLLGISLCLIQQWTGLVQLPLESYYVTEVPIALSLWPMLLLNAGTLTVCLLFLVLPTLVITRIAPARAIRFS